MQLFLHILPFAAAEVLLIWSIWQRRNIAFIISLLIVIFAFVPALIGGASSEIFGLMGGGLVVFGITCFCLGERIGEGTFISRNGLRAIGILLSMIGCAGTFVL